MRNLLSIIALAAGCSSSQAPEPAARQQSPTVHDTGLPTRSLAGRALVDPSRPISTDKLRAKLDGMKLTADQHRMLDQAFAREAARYELVRGETAMRKRAYELSQQTR